MSAEATGTNESRVRISLTSLKKFRLFSALGDPACSNEEHRIVDEIERQASRSST